MYVPVPQLRIYQKIHKRVVQELEKKFGGKHVLIVAKVSFCLIFNYIVIYIILASHLAEAVAW